VNVISRAFLAAVVGAFLASTTAAWGHMIPRSEPPSKMAPRQEYRYGAATERHAAAAIVRYGHAVRWFTRRADARRGQVSNPGFSLAYEHARVELRDHRWLLGYGRRIRAQGWARLHPAPPIAHLRGWLCIHSREGSWTDEGAPYYGGLQMTYGWMNVVGDAALLSPFQQMARAERVAAAHGFRYDWMEHQWPNTFPPCASLF
jgi:hypothetical protein